MVSGDGAETGRAREDIEERWEVEDLHDIEIADGVQAEELDVDRGDEHNDTGR